MIVLLEPVRPSGFASGGYRYQDEIGRRLAALGLGRQQALAPDQLAGRAAVARATGDTIVVDGLFVGLAPAVPGCRLLLHVLPEQEALRPWLAACSAVIATGGGTASAVAGILHAARVNGFLNTVVTTAPQVTSYLVEHAPQLRPDPFTGQLVAAALQARATQPDAVTPRRGLAEPLTAAELRILKLLPTSTYLQIADTLYISRNTVKVHLRSVYQKLGVASRAQALERAIDLSLL